MRSGARNTNAGSKAGHNPARTQRTPGLAQAISKYTNLPCEVVDPFRNIRIDERDVNPAFLADVGPQAAVAVGLAVRRAGDK